MSDDLNTFLQQRTLKNKKIIKPLVWISLSVGCNLTRITGFRDPIKIVNLTLILLAALGLFGQYYFIWEHRKESFLSYSDAVCTSFQTWISFSKLLQFFFTQRRFQRLWHMAKTSEILQDFEILKLSNSLLIFILFISLQTFAIIHHISNRKQIVKEIKEILQDSWKGIKIQANTFTISVFSIVCWYYGSCLAYNIFYTYIRPKEFYPLFPFQSSYPIWRDKGLQFPYYFILYIISGTDLHISGLGAISFSGVHIVLALHGLALLKISRKLLAHVTSDGVSKGQRVKFLVAWCRFHQRIYDYCDELNDLYYVQSAPLFLVSMLVMCLLIFQASVGLGTDFNLFIKMFLYFCAASIEVSMFCINGQRLTTENERIPMALYDCKWYDESAEFKVITHMMLVRTNRALELQVGGFSTMSFVTLLWIMRSSCSYFLLLREFNE